MTGIKNGRKTSIGEFILQHLKGTWRGEEDSGEILVGVTRQIPLDPKKIIREGLRKSEMGNRPRFW